MNNVNLTNFAYGIFYSDQNAAIVKKISSNRYYQVRDELGLPLTRQIIGPIGQAIWNTLKKKNE